MNESYIFTLKWFMILPKVFAAEKEVPLGYVPVIMPAIDLH